VGRAARPMLAAVGFCGGGLPGIGWGWVGVCILYLSGLGY